MTRKLLIILITVCVFLYSSSVWAEDVSTLLEEGIYAEETKGDLDEAISIYQKIIDENSDNSADIAKAYYRLGACYLKTGDDSKAIEIFKELLTRFNEQEEVASKAKTQLIKLNALKDEDEDNSLEFGQVPWKPGETCYYNIKTLTDMEIGKMISSVDETTVNGNDMWKFSSYTAAPIETTQTFTSVELDKESFLPVSSLARGTTAGMDIRYKILYAADHVKLDLDFLNNKSKKDIPIDGIVYDGEQLSNIIRMLPIKENYSSSFSLFYPLTGTVLKTNIKTLGRENITVPAGTFECYCIEVDLMNVLKLKYWLTADDNKYIVKIDTQTIVELERVEHKSTTDTVVFTDEAFGVSMSAPGDWQFIKDPIKTPFKLHLLILPPELKTDALFQFVITHYDGTPLNGVLDQEINQIKGAFKNFQERPDSRISSVIGGLNALSFTADYDGKDKKMVEYRTYIAGKDLIYVYILRSEKEAFENYKPDYDAVIESLAIEK